MRASAGRALANALELAKRAVDLDRLGELLHSSKVSAELVTVIVIVVASNGIAPEAATESRKDASKAADSTGKRALQAAAHLSDLVAVFERIRLAIMIAESMVRPLPERSMDSTGSVPLNFMISRGRPSILQAGVEWMRQRLLTFM